MDMLQLEITTSNGAHKCFSNEFLDSLTRMIIVIPYAIRAVTILACRVGRTVGCRIIYHGPERSRSVEDLTGDTGVGRFEGRQICLKRFVVRLDVVDETLQLGGSVTGEDRGFIEGYMGSAKRWTVEERIRPELTGDH